MGAALCLSSCSAALAVLFILLLGCGYTQGADMWHHSRVTTTNIIRESPSWCMGVQTKKSVQQHTTYNRKCAVNSTVRGCAGANHH